MRINFFLNCHSFFFNLTFFNSPVEVALSNNDGGCDAAFSSGNSCVECARGDHQQVAAALVTGVRTMPLRGIINTKNVRIFVTQPLLFQECYGRLHVIRGGVLTAQMRLAFDTHVVLLHPITVLTLLPFQNITQQPYVPTQQDLLLLQFRIADDQFL